jgi:tetraacyldisaccharide 4'-kinase
MRLRRWAYRRGLLPAAAAEAPVICVGNLTAGGTGKTPMAAWVAARLLEAGRRPAILTRGYKPAGGRSDEAELLRRLCEAAVVVGADRVAGARAAVAAGADALVMDDGFQHLRLRRDLDVVLIDATRPFGFGRCLPRGLLREPPAALRDAGAVVVTRSDAVSVEALARLRGRLSGLAPAAGVHAAVHEPAALLDDRGRQHPPDALAGRRAFAFCGLGNPEPFFALLGRLGVRLAGRRALDDHVAYTPAVLAALRQAAGACDADVAITTQKDAVKLPAAALPRAVWQLAVRMKILDGREALVRRILDAVGGQGGRAD